MNRKRRLAIACVALAAAWLMSAVISSNRAERCNGDDLTGCDTLGSILLGLTFILPVVLLVLTVVLIGLLVSGAIDAWSRSGRKRD